MRILKIHTELNEIFFLLKIRLKINDKLLNYETVFRKRKVSLIYKLRVSLNDFKT